MYPSVGRQASYLLHEDCIRHGLDLILFGHRNNRQSICWKRSKRMQDVGYILDKEILNGRSLGLLDALLDSLVDIIHELVLVFDALDYPIVHFVDQNRVETEVLKVVLFHPLSDGLQFLQDLRFGLEEVLC